MTKKKKDRGRSAVRAAKKRKEKGSVSLSGADGPLRSRSFRDGLARSMAVHVPFRPLVREIVGYYDEYAERYGATADDLLGGLRDYLKMQVEQTGEGASWPEREEAGKAERRPSVEEERARVLRETAHLRTRGRTSAGQP